MGSHLRMSLSQDRPSQSSLHSSQIILPSPQLPFPRREVMAGSRITNNNIKQHQRNWNSHWILQYSNCWSLSHLLVHKVWSPSSSAWFLHLQSAFFYFFFFWIRTSACPCHPIYTTASEQNLCPLPTSWHAGKILIWVPKPGLGVQGCTRRYHRCSGHSFVPVSHHLWL